MANNYLEFSEIIDGLTDEEIAWWEAEIARMNGIYDQINAGDLDEDHVEPMICQDFDLDANARQVWFHPDESGNPEAVAEVVHRFLKDTGHNDCFWLCWAETCSKPRIGEFGGGAVFVTADRIEWYSTEDWLQKLRDEFIGREKGFPHIDLCFQGWCRNVEVQTALDIEASKWVDLAGISASELKRKIDEGEWCIALSDCLGQSSKEEIEISDIEPS